MSRHKPPQRTDIFDSFAQFSHSYANQFGIYGIGEWFLNTSLGMAAERSAGGGVLFPAYTSPSGNFFAKTWVDFRYFNERLYAPRKLGLFGSVVHGEMNYWPSSGKWSLNFATALKPMWNEWGASQAGGSFTIAFPIGKHVCFSLTPADDTYVGNSPAGFRRNYLKSSVGLQVLAGSNRAQACK